LPLFLFVIFSGRFQPDTGIALPSAYARKDLASTGRPVFGFSGGAPDRHFDETGLVQEGCSFALALLLLMPCTAPDDLGATGEVIDYVLEPGPVYCYPGSLCEGASVRAGFDDYGDGIAGAERRFACYLRAMEVQLSPGQKAFVREAISSGRITNEEEAIRQALSLWEERERQRVEILAAVERAHASLARGEGRRISSEVELQQFADDVKRRGLARLTAEQDRS
jgi:putative addiction module CopG family antidote